MSIGYDKLNLNHQLLLHLTFEEMTGALTHDRAKPAHPCTLHGVPTWNSLANGLPYLEFDRTNPDWLDCGAVATADLNFLAGDFSVAAWVYRFSPNMMTLFCRAANLTDGWNVFFGTDGQFRILTSQLTVYQETNSVIGAAPLNAWGLVGLSRSGASIRMFGNGEDNTNTAGTHIDPATSNRELHVGIYDDEALNQMDGRIAGGDCGPRIWGRSLAASEHKQIFSMERHWFGI